jgi:hypothetical protein
MSAWRPSTTTTNARSRNSLPGWQFRPAKQIQRLMAVDAMRRLRAFRDIREYRYVGMGGFEFVDFDLVRRALGIHLMTSIESENPQERLEFNQPYPDIDLRFGTSNEMLPRVALDAPLIVWMDYCCPLRHDVLSDMLLLGEKVQPGSMLVVSVNADVPPSGKRLARLEEMVTRERFPLDISKEEDLDSWKWADAQRRIIRTEILKGIATRGGRTRFEQVLNIQYKDTRRMQTWAGVFVDPAHEEGFQRCAFHELDQFRPGSDPLRISIPILTAREVLNLQERLFMGQAPPSLPWLSARESQSFYELHRWYPPVPAPM